jgi:hypothetical protein
MSSQTFTTSAIAAFVWSRKPAGRSCDIFFVLEPPPYAGFTPPMRLKFGWKRPPVTVSMRSSTRSRSRRACISGVGAPSSRGNDDMNTR